MTELVIINGTVVTQDVDRTVLKNSAVAVQDGSISAVGPTADVTTNHTANQIIDADGGVIIPGLINPHTHVSDILLRGSFAENRGLLDWLYNVKRPGTLAMQPEEHATAATLYCAEAIRAGVTTFVENDTEVLWDDWADIEAKLEIYNQSGIRNIYGAGMVDCGADNAFQALVLDKLETIMLTTHHWRDLLRKPTGLSRRSIHLLRHITDPLMVGNRYGRRRSSLKRRRIAASRQLLRSLKNTM